MFGKTFPEDDICEKLKEEVTNEDKINEESKEEFVLRFDKYVKLAEYKESINNVRNNKKQY